MDTQRRLSRSYFQKNRCLVSKELVHGEPCLLGNAFQEIYRRRMNAANDVADRRLANANPLCELRLTRSRVFEVGRKCLHMDAEFIGFAYEGAIGQSYPWMTHSPRMAKERNFLDRATEALRERFPRDRPTQTKLAALAGVKQPSVNDWKTGSPAIDTGVRLALALGVCVEWLYTERGPKRPPKAQPDSLGPLSHVVSELDERQKAQLARFADFLKDES